jgi:hypothetical protein
MTDIIDRPIKAGHLPPELRGDFDPSAIVLVTVHRLTENGMTEAQEAAILAAEAETADLPFRPAAEVLAELSHILDEP